MTTQIIPNLSFGQNNSSLPTSGELLLITDHLDSSAEFILHRILSSHLREVKDPRVIVLSFALEFAHWRSIAAKSHTNLVQYQSSGFLTFINGLSFSSFCTDSSDGDLLIGASRPPLWDQIDGPGLRSLYSMIDRSLQYPLASDVYQTPSQRTVIIDDISVLELTGLSADALIRFIRALRALCRSRSASLVIRAHAPPLSETSVPFDSELLRFLLDSCHVHVEVRPLMSGRSGAVSGEVAVHRGGLLSDDRFVAMGRKSAMQYRLTDGGVVFFQRGMGGGVL